MSEKIRHRAGWARKAMSTDPDTDVPQADLPGVAGAGPGALERRGEVVRLLPIAVLVVSADRYFRAAATMLLTRRGCTVVSAAHEREALEQARVRGVDVLVVETEPPADRLPAPRSLAARIDAVGLATGRRVAPVGVVVVGEPEELGQALDAEAGTAHPALDKWGPFERLYQAICDRDRARRLAPLAGAGRWPGAVRRPGAG